ncbi:hypothetical protein COLO4_12788 [Corchorus olitorius]|uniref:Uncharacterized protein n=1 Tax=Corchorus olitorius TaxID=93759 RepID=A0A1R3JZK6_9ROSI|nr:hypothetical protein COLO4_12788 [Corchorus olitorius]
MTNNTAKSTAPKPAATSAPTELDFRNAPMVSKPNSFISATPSLEFKYKAKTESLEEGNCSSSGMTTDEEHKYPSNGQGLNLELSIGIGNDSTQVSTANSAESKPLLHHHHNNNTHNFHFLGQTMVAKAVCLCWQLGFQGSEICRNCQNTNGFYRYCRPLDS